MTGSPSGVAARLVLYPLMPARARALASSSRLTLLTAPSSWINRLRLTEAWPSTAFWAAFYDHLFRRCPDIKPMFGGRDMDTQHRILDGAVQSLLNFPASHVVEPTVLSTRYDGRALISS